MIATVKKHEEKKSNYNLFLNLLKYWFFDEKNFAKFASNNMLLLISSLFNWFLILKKNEQISREYKYIMHVQWGFKNEIYPVGLIFKQ